MLSEESCRPDRPGLRPPDHGERGTRPGRRGRADLGDARKAPDAAADAAPPDGQAVLVQAGQGHQPVQPVGSVPQAVLAQEAGRLLIRGGLPVRPQGRRRDPDLALTLRPDSSESWDLSLLSSRRPRLGRPGGAGRADRAAGRERSIPDPVRRGGPSPGPQGRLRRHPLRSPRGPRRTSATPSRPSASRSSAG